MKLRLLNMFLLFVVGGCCHLQVLSAHEVRPAYLEIEEVELGTYQVYWKVPQKSGIRLPVEPVFPNEFKPSTPIIQTQESDCIIQQWTTKSQRGLEGQKIRIEGLRSTMTDVLIRIKFLDGNTSAERLTAAVDEFTFPESPTVWSVFITYLVIGVEHILFGIDHLLFVLALLLVVDDLWKLVKTVTAFTIAHSITLVMATLNLASLPGPPVEALIALSIVLVAQEIIRKDRGEESFAKRQPWLIAFGFGLLHGFGFAGALAEVGLPQEEIPMALVAFNLGVELGQLMFVGVVIGIVKFASWAIESLQTNNSADGSQFLLKPLRYFVTIAIGSIAAFWFIERAAGVLFS